MNTLLIETPLSTGSILQLVRGDITCENIDPGHFHWHIWFPQKNTLLRSSSRAYKLTSRQIPNLVSHSSGW